MRLLFVDHEFHRKTRSSDFFRRLLEQFFDVQVMHVDPDDPQRAFQLPAQAPDLVVLWQMDYLAPVYLALGCRVVVIPMYDGSSTLPDIHWLWSKQARFVNFSRRLHWNIERCGAESLLVRYYPKPRRGMEKRSFDRLNVLLWQRRPEHGINLHLVENLLGAQISTLHVHDSADDKDLQTARYLKPQLDSYRLSVSTWFNNPSDYDALVERSNVYFAPRLSEGIGMGFLEAMANGMLVFAADAPTHDEYISNWTSGILINPATAHPVDVTDSAARLGRMAWKACELGHARWLASIESIIEFVREAPRPALGGRIDPERLAQGLITSYHAGIPTYTSFLLNNRAVLDALVPATARHRLVVSNAGAVIEQQIVLRNDPLFGDSASDLRHPWLDQNRFDASNPDCLRHLTPQSVALDAGCAWVLGDGVSLAFSIDPRLGVTSRLRVGYRTRDARSGVRYLLMLNGRNLAEGRFDATDGSIELSVPPGLLQHENTIRIQALGNPDAAELGSDVRGPWGLTRVELV